MNKTFRALLALTLILTIECKVVSVQEQCKKECSYYKSKGDCLMLEQCIWQGTDGICKIKETIELGYCPNIEHSVCPSTLGCAFLNNKCTSFAGCSAYMEQTTVGCQSISIRCISNGKTCINTQECKNYEQEVCGQAQDQFYHHCKWDSGANICRNYLCSEADSSYTTHRACNKLSGECITTGAGCVTKPLPNCIDLKGTAQTCPNMIGADGQCKFGEGDSCALLICSDYKNTTANITDEICQQFLSICLKSTGKGCTTTLGLCSSYTSQCDGYIGSDGVCEGDEGSTQCRARKCENGKFTTDQDCKKYKDGCVTNGIQCVAEKLNCSQYNNGMQLNCSQYIGLDGKCKGDSNPNTPCTIRDCEDDSEKSYTTDEQCQKNIQSYCRSTGQGCVKTLQSCTTYFDQQDCNTRVGSDGKCKAGQNGRCTAVLCTDAPTHITTNEECNSFQIGCVSNGAGCTSTSSCATTFNQLSCIGTLEYNANCNWSGKCVANIQCSDFSEAYCSGQKISVIDKDIITIQPCVWNGFTCRSAICTDYQVKDDASCNIALSGCVFNGSTGCVSPSPCSNFKGNKASCLSYKAQCTNTDYAAQTDFCISRSCSDNGLTFKTDLECQSYFSGCLTNGNGCVSNTAPCSSYSGTQIECDKFYGFYEQKIKGARCWNNLDTSAQCIEKRCEFATNMKQNLDCQQFLNGCLYDGNGSCVSEMADCTSYKGNSTASCSIFKGNQGKSQCWWQFGGNCVTKQCNQNISKTDQECNNFMQGCVTSGVGCIDLPTQCSIYSGTTLQCNQLTYKSLNGISSKCTRIDQCTTKTCSNKIDAITNSDCVSYHQQCRIQFNSSTCMLKQVACTSYSLNGTNNAAKMKYCNSLTIDDNVTLCGYNSSVPNTCSIRKCEFWVNTLNDSCNNYAGINSCRLAVDGSCYTPKPCVQYIIPSGVTDKLSWCKNYNDNSNPSKLCIYVQTTSSTNCIPTYCEYVPQPTSAAYCNTYIGSTNCQYFGGKCFTTFDNCNKYSFDFIPSNMYNDYCSAAKMSLNRYLTKCKYDAASQQCGLVTCTDIKNAKSQADCDAQVYKCKYFSGLCYPLMACTSRTVSQFSDNASRRLFCINMLEWQTGFCTYFDNSPTCDSPKSCAEISGGSLSACNIHRDKIGFVCSWVSGGKCQAPVDAITSCTHVPGVADNDWYCHLRTMYKLCYRSNQSKCELRFSPDCTSRTFTGTTPDEKALSCQVFAQLVNDNCTWMSAANTCEKAPNYCSDWKNLDPKVDNTNFCKIRISLTGDCVYDLGATNCRNHMQWEDYVITCQVDCDLLNTSSVYYLSTCYIPSTNCSSYYAVGTNSDAKFTYCNGLTNTNGGACTFVKGYFFCTNKSNCTTYAISGEVSEKQTICSNMPTIDQYGCTYWPGKPETCFAIGTCTGYFGTTSSTVVADCASQKDNNNKTCTAASNGTSCVLTNSCETISNPQSQFECDKYLSGCLYYDNKCYTLGDCSSYSLNGTISQQFCLSMKDKSGVGCTLLNQNTCISKKCSDVNYSTHAQCKAYLPTCKSNGSQCIDVLTSCNQQQGTEQFCQSMLDTDGISTCTQATINSQCTERTCEQNFNATSDSQCETYLSGCLTNGQGCISNTEPCNKYFGTVLICKAFTGNFIKCWGGSDNIIDACRDRKCTDNKIATTDSDCDTFLSGCLTNGAGCISSKAPCSSYKGTQETCNNFKGLDKTVLCYNTQFATNSTPCKDKVCTDFNGTSDTDCAQFLPSQDSIPNCVYNGTNCVKYPIKCSDFKGTETTCPTFTAIDGPCKTTTYTTTPMNCVSKVCTEAPNTLITDADCQQYHPSCKTNGKGCVQSQKCDDIITTQACEARPECTWLSVCYSSQQSCQGYKNQISCINTPLSDKKTYCAWSNNNCHNFTCDDYDRSYTTHEQCNLKDSTCTTTGSGCVKLGVCSSYKTPQTCAAATTTEQTLRCTWVQNDMISPCRPRKCTDLQETSNESCNKFLKGCKTSGSSCIDPIYDCSIFNGNPSYCLSDSIGNACLYIKGVCYKFNDCNDGIGNSLADCQLFDINCVPNGSGGCTTLTSCDEYTSQQSCSIGTNSSICGWLPNGKCQIFSYCSDAIGTTNLDCQIYGSKCITDGVQCVDIGLCSSYKTNISCQNLGTDGVCTWIPSLNQCRLKRCSDYILTSNVDCSKQVVSYGKCTSDGISCVDRLACSSYKNVISCTIGIDGIPCVFDNQCRTRECSDIKGSTSSVCLLLKAKKTCVSNGEICINQSFCQIYKNKESCNGGGIDGICVFLPFTIDSQEGKCQLFSSCEKANQDEVACKKKSSCIWSENPKSCQDRSCSDQIVESDCKPIPNFNEQQFTICNWINGACEISDPSTFDSSICYSKSAYTYTWSQSDSKCVQCEPNGRTVNNTNETNSSNQTSPSNTTNQTKGLYILTIPFFILLIE